jgi:hypothetical protein
MNGEDSVDCAGDYLVDLDRSGATATLDKVMTFIFSGRLRAAQPTPLRSKPDAANAVVL